VFIECHHLIFINLFFAYNKSFVPVSRVLELDHKPRDLIKILKMRFKYISGCTLLCVLTSFSEWLVLGQ